MNSTRQLHQHPVRISTGLLAGALVQTACGSSTPPSQTARREGDTEAPSVQAPAEAEPIVTPLESEGAPDENRTRLAEAFEIEDTAPPRRQSRPRVVAPPADTFEVVDATEPEPEPELDRVTGASASTIGVEEANEIETAPPPRADAVSRSYVEEATTRTSGWGF